MADRNDLLDGQLPWLIATWEGDPRGGSGFYCLRCGTHMPRRQDDHWRRQVDGEEQFILAHRNCILVVELERMAPLARTTFAEALAGATVYLREAQLQTGEPVRVRLVDGYMQGVRIVALQENDLDPLFRRFTDAEQSEPEPDPTSPPASLLEAPIWAPL